jgi:hypothetical protein
MIFRILLKDQKAVSVIFCHWFAFLGAVEKTSLINRNRMTRDIGRKKGFCSKTRRTHFGHTIADQKTTLQFFPHVPHVPHVPLMSKDHPKLPTQ